MRFARLIGSSAIEKIIFQRKISLCLKEERGGTEGPCKDEELAGGDDAVRVGASMCVSIWPVGEA